MARFGVRQWVVVVTVATAALLQLIDTSIVNVTLTQMMGSLGATLEDIGWVVTAYAVANVIVIALSGWLAQRIGRKRYFIGSIVLFTAASLLCGMADNVWELVAFRFIQGMGGGGILTTSQAIIVETFPREDLPFANAIYGMTVVIGPTIGPTLGGWITDNLSWNWVFYVNIPVGIAATLLARFFLPQPSHPARSPSGAGVDAKGILLLVAGIGSLQVVLERGQSEGWFDSAWITGLAVVAAVSVVGFVWNELRVPQPVVHLRLLRSRSYAVGVVFCFIQGLGLFSSMFLIPVFAQSLLGFTATDTGMLLVPGSITTALTMPVIGKIMQKGAPARLLAGGGFLLFAVFLLVVSGFTDRVGSQDFFWPLIVRGIGMGMIFIPLTTLALGQLQGPEIPQGTAMTNMVRQLGGSVGIALVTSFVNRRMVFHRSVLGERVDVFNPAAWERIHSSAGALVRSGEAQWSAQAKAVASLGGAVARQAALMSYLDAFRVVALFFLASLPFLALFKPARRHAPVPEVHAE